MPTNGNNNNQVEIKREEIFKAKVDLFTKVDVGDIVEQRNTSEIMEGKTKEEIEASAKAKFRETVDSGIKAVSLMLTWMDGTGGFKLSTLDLDPRK